MTPYPPSLPTDAALIVADAARKIASGQGGNVNKDQAVHACWDLAGYGLSIGLPDRAVMMGTSGTTCTPSECNTLADTLEECCRPGMKADSSTRLPWGNILAIVLRLLPLILAA